MPVRTASVERESASSGVCLVVHCFFRRQCYVRRARIASRIAPPPFATSIRVRFDPPSERGADAETSAASMKARSASVERERASAVCLAP